MSFQLFLKSTFQLEQVLCFFGITENFPEGQGRDRLNELVEDNTVQGVIYLMHRVKGTENCHMPSAFSLACEYILSSLSVRKVFWW